MVNIGTDPVIVKAVKAENAKRKTLAQIKEMDKKWRATPGIADFIQALMDSECGKAAQKLSKLAEQLKEMVGRFRV